MKELLRSVIADQLQLVWRERYLTRKIPADMVFGKGLVVISGIRRCGKSTLLHQIRWMLPERDYYLNFDDERLIHFTVEHFQVLHELFIELFGEQKTFYFDEIQNIAGWERFVRRLDDYGYKIFLTGSNARMLSRELGTHLTGRYIQLELFPFSFSEFLEWSKVSVTQLEISSTAGKAKLAKRFSDYTSSGGFPAFLESGNDLYIKSLYESILFRDVMVRNNLTNEKELLELVYYLASNVSKLSSYNSLTRVIGVKNATTIKNYLGFLQDSYLIFQINKYDASLKKQLHNSKKTYFIDNAVVLKLGFSFSPQSGRLLENLVFIELRRRGREVFYHQQRAECDFVIRESGRIVEVIQVCYRFDEGDVAEREINGLAEAMHQYGLPEGTILTLGTNREIGLSGKKIIIREAWKWFLEGNIR